MTWRPSKWCNPYSKESDPLHMGNQELNYTDFEAGADVMFDAMIEHLEKENLKFFDCMYSHGSIRRLLQDCFGGEMKEIK